MDSSSQPMAIRVGDLVRIRQPGRSSTNFPSTVPRGEILGLVGASGAASRSCAHHHRSVYQAAAASRVLGLIRTSEPARGRGVGRRWASVASRARCFHADGGQKCSSDARENLHLSDRLLDELATAKLEMVGLTADEGDKFPAELRGE